MENRDIYSLHEAYLSIYDQESMPTQSYGNVYENYSQEDEVMFEETSFELYDLVLEYLIDEEYVDSIHEAAEVVAGLDENTILGILEEINILGEEENKPAGYKKVTAYDLAYGTQRALNQLEKNKGSKRRWTSDADRSRKKPGILSRTKDAIKRALSREYFELYGAAGQLNEISKDLALRAHATRATYEFENDSDHPGDFTKSGQSKADKTRRQIVKKFGKSAGREADRAAERGIYGHNDYSEAQERDRARRGK